MTWMPVLAKKTKTPRKTQKKQQPKEYQTSKCQLEGARFLHLAFQGVRLAPCPPVSYATGYSPTCLKIILSVCWKRVNVICEQNHDTCCKMRQLIELNGNRFFRTSSNKKIFRTSSNKKIKLRKKSLHRKARQSQLKTTKELQTAIAALASLVDPDVAPFQKKQQRSTYCTS